MANLGVTLVNENNEIVGYAALYDQPNWLLDKSIFWPTWIKENFVEEKCDVCEFFLLLFTREDISN